MLTCRIFREGTWFLLAEAFRFVFLKCLKEELRLPKSNLNTISYSLSTKWWFACHTYITSRAVKGETIHRPVCSVHVLIPGYQILPFCQMLLATQRCAQCVIWHQCFDAATHALLDARSSKVCITRLVMSDLRLSPFESSHFCFLFTCLFHFYWCFLFASTI